MAVADRVTHRDGTAGRVLHSRAEAEAYVASVCFKHGPPRLVGAELEWTVHHADDPRRPLAAGLLADALGAYAPRTLCSTSPQRPLPRGGTVSVEPGGQVEISSRPRSRIPDLLTDLAADTATLTTRLAAAGLVLGTVGADPHRPPRRLLRTPRYDAMEAAFATVGGDGLRMMCSTAAVQVCVDAGTAADVAARWAALHAAGPALHALFANAHHGDWVSERQRAVWRSDPVRMRPGAVGRDPAGAWARHALDAAVMCVPGPGSSWRPPRPMSFADWIAAAVPRRPTVSDLEYHLSTLFPPVRPHGYLEVRYLDAQPGDGWTLPVALVSALLADGGTVTELLAAAAPARNRWLHAARHGLADPRIRAAAEGVVALGRRALAGAGLGDGLTGGLIDALERRLLAAPGPLAPQI